MKCLFFWHFLASKVGESGIYFSYLSWSTSCSFVSIVVYVYCCFRFHFGDFSIICRAKMPPPDRWQCYTPFGKPIPSTPFIAFKVPLKEELMIKIQERDKFSPNILIKSLEQQGHKLGGIIDLTFTLKYYNKEEFEKNSIKYWKIFTKGHEVPSEDVFQKFAQAVKTVENSGTLVGVHCTHGVNRTGYLICRYMIEELNMEPDNAIALFNEARGHDLERENYLEDLKQRIKGKSSYDPDYIFTECLDTQGSNQGYKNKERWRKNRDDHPNWQRNDRGFTNRFTDALPSVDGSHSSNTYSHYHHRYWSTNETDAQYRQNHNRDNFRSEQMHNESQRWVDSKHYQRRHEDFVSRKWSNDRNDSTDYSCNRYSQWQRNRGEPYHYTSFHENKSFKEKDSSDNLEPMYKGSDSCESKYRIPKRKCEEEMKNKSVKEKDLSVDTNKESSDSSDIKCTISKKHKLVEEERTNKSVKEKHLSDNFNIDPKHQISNSSDIKCKKSTRKLGAEIINKSIKEKDLSLQPIHQGLDSGDTKCKKSKKNKLGKDEIDNKSVKEKNPFDNSSEELQQKSSYCFESKCNKSKRKNVEEAVDSVFHVCQNDEGNNSGSKSRRHKKKDKKI